MDVIQNLTTLEFAEKYAYFNNANNAFEFGKIDLYDFQKDLLHKFDNFKYNIIRQPRQMGVTTMFVIFLTKKLLTKSNKGTNSIILTNNYSSSFNILDKIKRLAQQINPDIVFENKSRKFLKYGNNTIKILEFGQIKGNEIDYLVIDNANSIKNLEKIWKSIIPALSVNAHVICSSPDVKNYTFFKKLYLDDNLFTKINLNWYDHPNRDEKWFNVMKKTIGENFETELNLLEPKLEISTPEKNTISFRINTELLDKLKNKLLNEDISLSEYLRSLIQKDLD